MICPVCGAANREGRKFCASCGTTLAWECTRCGARNLPDERFCGECGASPATAPQVEPQTTPPGKRATSERRLVSVLFADLVGFTPFAEERDAEEVRSVLSRYFDVTREVIERYGGTVEKFIGDAVMAVWGTPVAHEDDAERAVRAALELTDAVRVLGPGIAARAAVLTGEAAVTLGATDQGMVAGDLVNTAARLQSAAPPGAVLVGEPTMRAAAAALAFEPAGEQLLKGKATPVSAWRAVRVVAQRRGAGRSETLETPFVGRDEEFRLVRELLHLAGRDPRPRLVSITGPAGIGKSRLAWELEKYVDGVVETIYWHRGRCPAYGEGITFWALGEMVRARCRLAEADDETTTRERVAATVVEYVTDESERGWIESALLALLAAGPAPPGGREMLFAAWRRFFEHIAARGTTVLVFEDLHWADQGLLDFIDHLLDWSKGAPLLVVTLARPELFDRRPDWGATRRTYTALALDPLPAPAMRALLAGLVPQLPEEAVRAIVDRADGIPLYAVETVRMLLADGRLLRVGGAYQPAGEVGELAVPDSLRSLITSRLDALEPSDRALLQDASVLGLTFAPDALGIVTGRAPEDLASPLRRLVRRELLTVESDPRSPERGQYGFVQSLTREVAYGTLARSDRRSRHLAAARHYEAVAGDETAGILANHYLAAYRASTEGPEADAVAVQARLALRGAADRAAALGGHDQAASYLEQALSVTGDPAERAALLERQALEAGLAGHHGAGETAGRSAIHLYRKLGDSAGTARARGRLGTLLIESARIPEAIVELEAAEAELPEDVPPAVRADVLAKLARAYYRNMEERRAAEVADRALAIAEHHGLRATIAECLVSKGTALGLMRRTHEAIVLLRGGGDLARREGDIETALRGAANLAVEVGANEGLDEALRIAREALDLARTVGDVGQIVWQLGNVSSTALHRGLELAPLVDELRETMPLVTSEADRFHVEHRILWLTSVRGDASDDELARHWREAEQGRDPHFMADVQRLMAFHALAAGDARRAAEHAGRLGEDRPEYGTMPMAVWCAALAGDAALARTLLARLDAQPVGGRLDEGLRSVAAAAVTAVEGRVDEALPAFREGTRRLREMEDLFDVAVAGLVMARTLGPDVPDARAAAEESLAIFEAMGAPPLAAQVRAELDQQTPSPPRAAAAGISQLSAPPAAQTAP